MSGFNELQMHDLLSSPFSEKLKNMTRMCYGGWVGYLIVDYLAEPYAVMQPL